jgi:invasion protein IalB
MRYSGNLLTVIVSLRADGAEELNVAFSTCFQALAMFELEIASETMTIVRLEPSTSVKFEEERASPNELT